jgi:transcriptional regulator with XRE-family HTH domain
MKNNLTPAERFAQAIVSEDFAIDSAKLAFTEEMLHLMEVRGLNRVQLAEKLQVKPSRITAMLRGAQNFTFATAVRVAHVLNADFVTKLRPKEKECRWELYDEQSVHPAFQVGPPRRLTWPSQDDQKIKELVKNEVQTAA